MKYINWSVSERKFTDSGDFNLTAHEIGIFKYAFYFPILVGDNLWLENVQVIELLI